MIRKTVILVRFVRNIVLAIIRGLFLWMKTRKTKDRYCIKVWYLPRRKRPHFDATHVIDQYQDEIYKVAHDLCVREKLSSILDIGCGSGFKLMKYLKDFQTTGTELEPALSHLRNTYPDRKWVVSDLDNLPEDKYDLVISVEVIEHLIDPDVLMKYISGIEFKYVILSTPERDMLGIRRRVGPPANPHHVREWNQEEFKKYCSKFFHVDVSAATNDCGQYVICKK